jgi:DNA-binding NarL/FixJ family response regulator
MTSTHYGAKAARRSLAERAPSAGAAPTPPVALSEAEWQTIARNLRLSARELEIVRCTLDDCKDRAIAARLHMAVGTVRTHRARLYRKLGVHSRNRLILRVLQERPRPDGDAGAV